MTAITFKKITNLPDAEAAWKELSPNSVIYDSWDFRYAYYKYFNYPIEFIAGYDGNELIGLLPLMWNPEKNYLEFFMSVDYMEDNHVFVKPGYEQYCNEFLKQITRPAHLEYLSTPELTGSDEHDTNYSIDLQPLHSYQEFLDSYLSKETGKKVTAQMRKIEELNLTIGRGDFSDLGLLRDMNIQRFGAHSSYSDRPHWEAFISDVVNLFNHIIVTIMIDGKKEAVGLALIHNNICYGINSGYNDNINNLGKYVTMIKIQEAIKEGCTTYNAGAGAYGWKEDFHLLKRPMYKLDLNTE